MYKDLLPEKASPSLAGGLDGDLYASDRHRTCRLSSPACSGTNRISFWRISNESKSFAGREPRCGAPTDDTMKFRDIPIRWKLTLVSVATSAAVLLLASAGFFVFDLLSYRAHLLDRTRTLADVIGANSAAAVTFQDPQVANRIIQALDRKQDILHGAILNADGSVLAQFVRPGYTGEVEHPRFRFEGHEFRNNHLCVFRPVELEGEQIGAAMVCMSMKSTWIRLGRYSLIIGAILVTSLIAAWVLAYRLQEHISRPITDLTKVAARVSSERDYSIRAGGGGQDEIGALMEGFDRMLEQIEHSDRELRRNGEHLRSLAHELTLTEEHERRQLALGLHDLVCQLLAVANMRLGRVRSKEHRDDVAEELGEIGELVTESLAQARTLTFQLSPPQLYDVGLEAALEQLVKEMRTHYGLPVELEAGEDDTRAEDDIAVMLYRSVRELLMNACKHADATSVRVCVVRVGNRVRVVVSDNGKGFCPENETHPKPEGGFGLFSIRERMEQLGGVFEVQCSPGEGTRAILEAPITRDFEAGSPSASAD